MSNPEQNPTPANQAAPPAGTPGGDGGMAPAESPAGGEFERDLEAIRRHYTETFLPSSPWSALINGHPYLCHRQRQRRMRQALIECGYGGADALRTLDVLDVGCGAGGKLAWLVELGADAARLTGVDLLPQRIDVARSRYSGIRFLAGDFLKADVGGPFDVVLMLTVLTSVPNPELKRRIMNRALSLLKPGGLFFFEDIVTQRESRGSATYKALTFEELESYFAPRKLRYFRKDLLRVGMADRLLPRIGITLTEMVQATGLFNADTTFAYARG